MRDERDDTVEELRSKSDGMIVSINEMRALLEKMLQMKWSDTFTRQLMDLDAYLAEARYLLQKMTKDEAFARAIAERWGRKNGAECPRCNRVHSFLAPDKTEVCPPCWYKAAPSPSAGPAAEVAPAKPIVYRKGRLQPGVENLFREDLTVLSGTYLEAEEQGPKEDQGGRTSAMKRELAQSRPPLIDLDESFLAVQEARKAEKIEKGSLLWIMNAETAEERNEAEKNRAYTHYQCAECGIVDRTTLRSDDLGRTIGGLRVCASCWTLEFAPFGRLYGTTEGARRTRRDKPQQPISFEGE